MRLNLEQWIEEVRKKPEHVRVRYVIGCVAASMVLVVGVWLLSVSESFKTVAGEAETGALNQVLPKPADFSLDALIEGKQSLGTQDDPVTGDAFFENQQQEKSAPVLGDEGVMPKTTPER